MRAARRLVRRKGAYTGRPVTPVAMLLAMGSQEFLNKANTPHATLLASAGRGSTLGPAVGITGSHKTLRGTHRSPRSSGYSVPEGMGALPGILALRKVRQEDQEFKVMPSYIGSRLGVPTRPRPCYCV